MVATFPLYLAAVRAIVGERVGYLLAAAFPAVLCNFIVGQNGFLSAALLGGALLFIERRPVLAGMLIGLLTYKPHLGLLFPIVLAASGHWRVFIAAGITAALMALVSWRAFGTDTWLAFFGNIGHTSQAFLSDGWADFGKLQTVFGLTRMLGGAEPLAWTLQGDVALACAAAVALLWRSDADTTSRPRRSAAAPCWRRPISISTTWWCWRCRWPFCSGSAARADFCPTNLPASASPACWC